MRIIFIAILFTCVLSTTVLSQQKLRPGQAAPVFSAASLNGQWYDLSSLRGKVVVVTFWTTRCPICHSEIPKLNKLAERYKGQDVVFLGVTTDNEAIVQNYLKRTPFGFNILPNGFGVVLQYADKDRSGRIDMGFPAHFVLDQSGAVGLRASGWDKTPDLEAGITRLLGSAQAGTHNSPIAASRPR